MYKVTDSAENSLKPLFLFISRLVVFIMFVQLIYFYLNHCTLATHLTVYNVLEYELYYTLLLLNVYFVQAVTVDSKRYLCFVGTIFHFITILFK